MTEIDIGARCENHAGEAFPPRCADCTAAAATTVTLADGTPDPATAALTAEHEAHRAWKALAEGHLRTGRHHLDRARAAIDAVRATPGSEGVRPVDTLATAEPTLFDE